MKVKAVIFDFNGTLYFDAPYHVKAWEEMSLEMCGKQLSETLPVTMIGLKNVDVINIMKPGISSEENERYSRQKEAKYRNNCLKDKENLHLVKGANELFQHLSDIQLPFTIASASIKDNIDFFVDVFELDTYFDPSKIKYDDGTYPTKVEMFKDACDILGVDPKDTLVFEDSVAGITHAKESGIGYIVAVGIKEKHAQQLELGAAQCICDFTQFDTNLLK